ncbi:hypothetical protein [Mesorhizobium sp. M0138]|uniref:hypothetical protein n=1 Tax=Mesorhizobium sp. M0138 TaxID=2956891 RepID=UPI00333A31E6
MRFDRIQPVDERGPWRRRVAGRVAVSLAESWGTSIVKAGDVAKRAAPRSNLKTLADMFVDPRSVDLIRGANGRGFKSGLGDALLRTGAEAGVTLFDPAGQR